MRIEEPTPVTATDYDEDIYTWALQRLALAGDKEADRIVRDAWGQLGKNLPPNINIAIAAIHYEADPAKKDFYKRVKKLYAPAFAVKRLTS